MSALVTSVTSRAQSQEQPQNETFETLVPRRGVDDIKHLPHRKRILLFRVSKEGATTVLPNNVDAGWVLVKHNGQQLMDGTVLYEGTSFLETDGAGYSHPYMKITSDYEGTLRYLTEEELVLLNEESPHKRGDTFRALWPDEKKSLILARSNTDKEVLFAIGRAGVLHSGVGGFVFVPIEKTTFALPGKCLGKLKN